MAIIDKQQVILNNSFISVNQPGNFEISLSDITVNTDDVRNMIVILIENPFTTDEIELLTEGVKFTNLITIKP